MTRDRMRLLGIVREAITPDGHIHELEFSEVEWKALLRQTRTVGVMPLLYRWARVAYAVSPVPDWVMGTLLKSYAGTANHNAFMLQEFSNVLRIYNAENIPVIALKGAHLLGLLYRDIGLRAMGDIDVLIHEADLSAVQRLLCEEGFVTTDNEAFQRKHQCHMAYKRFVAPFRHFHIEVHWRVICPSEPLNVDLDSCWERAETTTISGEMVKVFCMEDTLLHLCLHCSAHHLFLGGFRSLCDITLLLEQHREQLDWGRIIHCAYSWRAARYVHIVLTLARDLLGAQAPERVLEELERDRYDSGLQILASEILFKTTAQILDSREKYSPIETLHMPRRAPLKGAKSLRKITGKTVTLDGEPISDARVDCISRSCFVRAETCSDAAGRFECQVPDYTGKIFLAAWKEELFSLWQGLYEVGQEDIVLKLCRRTTVVGRVIDANETPQRGVRINLMPIELDIPPEELVELSGLELYTCSGPYYTNDSGQFEIKNVFAGTYRTICESSTGTYECDTVSLASNQTSINIKLVLPETSPRQNHPSAPNPRRKLQS